MTRYRNQILLAVGLGLLFMNSYAAASDIDKSLEMIAGATEPSAVISAYAKGLAVDPGSIQLREAYVRRMVSMGQAALLDTQANELLAADPDHGLALGVKAFIFASQDRMEEAINAIVRAAKAAPDEPFVLNTAGQLVAWYDVQADQSKLSEELRMSLDALRKDHSSKTGFSEGYSATRRVYEEQQAAAIGTDEAAAQPGAQVPPAGTQYPVQAASPYYYPYPYSYAYPYGYPYVPFVVVRTYPRVFFFGHHHRFKHHGFFFRHHRFKHGKHGLFFDFHRRARPRFFFKKHHGFNRRFRFDDHRGRGRGGGRLRFDHDRGRGRFFSDDGGRGRGRGGSGSIRGFRGGSRFRHGGMSGGGRSGRGRGGRSGRGGSGRGRSGRGRG